MKFMREHWQYVGACLGIIIVIFLLIVRPDLNTIQYLLVLNLTALFAHQFEEYALPGGAPSIINRVVYNETDLADRYPGNTLSIMLVNMSAWVIYLISILFSDIIWLGLGVIFFSLFQIIGHGMEMNIKLKTWYNPGLLTTIILFAPIGFYFIYYIATNNLITGTGWALAVITLLVCIMLSIVMPVQLLKDKETRYIISDWQLERYKKVTDFAKIRKRD